MLPGEHSSISEDQLRAGLLKYSACKEYYLFIIATSLRSRRIKGRGWGRRKIGKKRWAGKIQLFAKFKKICEGGSEPP